MIKLFTQPACKPCRDTKDLLDDLGIEYETIDVATNDAARDFLVETLGVKQTPVVLLDDATFWSGFDKDRIKALAQE